MLLSENSHQEREEVMSPAHFDTSLETLIDSAGRLLNSTVLAEKSLIMGVPLKAGSLRIGAENGWPCVSIDWFFHL